MSQVNVIISLGSERLHSDMVRRFDGHKTTNDDPITVIKLDKSGGCADRDDTYLQQTRQAQIREYFFGDRRRTLSPHTQTVDFNSITIYKIRECKPANHFLPNYKIAPTLPFIPISLMETLTNTKPTLQQIQCSPPSFPAAKKKEKAMTPHSSIP